MKCPACQNDNPSGQKFCGSCGHKLESECTHCGIINPPHYKFCGNCGASFTMGIAISLARSGLITRADHKTATLLGLKQDEMQGKPFTLFIDRVDMVIFFSHWNELLSSAKKQTFELALKHKENKSVYVAIECSVADRSSGNADEYLLVLNEVTENRLVSAQLQHQQDLLGLIFTTTDNISSVNPEHFDQSLEDALKKICLFTKADRSFIYSVNRPNRCLELAYQWGQPSSVPPNDNGRPKSIPLKKIKRAMSKFLQEHLYIVNDVSKLSRAEHDELLKWHPEYLGAVMCHLIHSGKKPIGIIGVAKNKADEEWPSDCIALIKFIGQMVSDKLPITGLKVQAADEADRPSETPEVPKKATPKKLPDKAIDAVTPRADAPAAAKATEPKTEPEAKESRPTTQPSDLPDMSKPMLLEKLSDSKAEDQQTVFPRDDGLVLLTCSRCGHQESISMGWFEKLGNAIKVNCPCKKHFAAVLEKRRAHRKFVNLDGFFTLKSDLEQNGSASSIWGPMVVKDLSKTGLRFTSDRSGLVHTGDLLMVRFNLDNSNQALIHKPARVIHTTGNQVGCQFEGDDIYDITLGFYFI